MFPRWVAALHTLATFADALVMIVVVAAWLLPKRFRPWYRAVLLLSATQFAPKSSFFMYLVYTVPLVLTTALVLTLRNPDAFRDET